MEQIWVVSAYSDRCFDHMICWYDDRADAESRAELMNALSLKWGMRFKRDWATTPLTQMEGEAIAEIGDTLWSHAGNITYRVVPLCKGVR